MSIMLSTTRGLEKRQRDKYGEVAEYDLDAWREMLLQPAEAPEDWRSAFELDDEDMLDPDLPMHPEDWNNPLNSIETDIMNGVEDY